MKFSKFYFNYAIKTMVFTVMLLVSVSIVAQSTSYSDSWSKHGISLQKQSKQSVALNFSVESFTRMPLDINGRVMEKINTAGSFLPNEEGAPDMPVISRYVAIPQGASVKLIVKNARIAKLQNIEISPSPRIPLDTEKGPLKYQQDNNIYSKNAYYPSEAVSVSKPMKIRGLDVVMISYNAFQYNPVTKEMLVNRDMEVEIEFVGGNGHFGEDKYRNRFWDPILRDAVINDESIDKNYTRNNKTSVTGCEYLIIVPDDADFLSWADSIRIFRQKQGIETQIVTLTELGGNTTSAIETYINTAYNEWDIPPAAVLLMADYGTSGVGITSPIYDNYCISDNIYADVDNDHMPDIAFARITARNNAELETIVHKALNYERNPPTNPNFYSNPITAMGWQTERWFQICSEVIAGYFETVHEKTPVRENAIYQGNSSGPWSTATNTATVIAYFGEAGLGYIPNSPSYLTDWGGNATRINNDINAGAFLLQHRDHGDTDRWGEPSYSNSDIAGTTNTDLTYIFSVNCLTGKFNISGECFVEKFHRHQYGALGLIGATEVSYSFVNDTYIWGAFDNMWPDFMPEEETTPMPRGVIPAFGNVAGKYFLQQSGWPYNQNNKEVTYYLFHTHGDAFTQLYYEVPQELTVDHNDVILSGLNYFTVNANGGSFICLSVDGEIIGTAEATGTPVDVFIEPLDPGVVVDVVITKQNFYRYEESVEVIPPDGAYCIYDGHQINDSLGNGNNKVEFDEEVFISLIMENLGNEDATDVMVDISEDNPYYSLIDSTENYETIPSGETVNKENAFRINIANNIPDQTILEFQVNAVDASDSSWKSKLFMTVNAPNITPGEMEIDDSETGNNNGRLDPGETADIRIKTYNKGHCIINDVLVSLVPYNNFIVVNTEDQLITTLSTLGGKWLTFNVSVVEDAPEAVIANMLYTATAAGYIVEKNYFPKIGQFMEDFETGNFNKFEWQNGGDLPWELSMQYPYDGLYHAVSGEISDNQNSELSISYEVMSQDVIRFMRKVACEQDFDELRFYIDGVEKDSWSGSLAYTQYEYDVEPGMHTFKWEFVKDYSGQGGLDAVWLDNIELPTMLVTTIFAGVDAEVCSNAAYNCQASATNYTSINWETSGDGIFDDVSILNPIYTPGTNDAEVGEVVLTMNIIDNDEEEVSDDVVLTFMPSPIAPAMPDGDDYIDVYKITESNYTTSIVETSIGYSWELVPEEAGELFENDNEARVFWNPNFMGDVILKVKAINECGEGEFSEDLNIIVDNTVGINNVIDGLKMNISPNPNNGVFNLEIVSEEEVNIRLVNYIGLSVFEMQNINAENGFSYDFNMKDIASGIYLLNVTKGNITFSKKVLINK